MNKVFKDKKVLIMGLGLNGGGVSSAKFFYNQGADILVTDLKTEIQLKESLEKLKKIKAEYVLGKHREENFKTADIIIKNPDVPNSSPYLDIARKNNIPIETPTSFFLKSTKSFIIGITGTKGKSTTSALIYSFLKSKYKNVFLAGNIGLSPFEIIGKAKKGSYVVLELSSFELENLKQSPDIAVITNILPDHLNRYKDMSEYADSKKIIFKYQDKKDYLILNQEDLILKKFAKEAVSKVIFFSTNKIKSSFKKDNFRLIGKHNFSNLAAAVSVAEIMKIPASKINKVIKSFKGIPNRQEFIRNFRGVKYYNDTAATMPDAVIAAINAFSTEFPDSRIILICGGQNKGLSFVEMSLKIKEKVSEIILFPGTASDMIMRELGDFEKVYRISSMQEAVETSFKISDKGDIVVLSPGAASFNMFKNEFDRGIQFIKAVKNLK
jgi:UDP-N-acetylmuramoylalanine--D-glutamate ligase